MSAWLGYALGDMFLIGLSAVLAKTAQKKNNSNIVATLWGILFLISVIIVMRITNSGQSLSGILARSWLFLVLSGCALGAAWLFLFRALKTGEVIKIVPVYLSYHVMAMLMRMILFHTQYSMNQKIAMALLAIGTLLIALHTGTKRKGGYTWLWFSLLASGSACASVLLAEYGVAGVNEGPLFCLRVAVAVLVAAIAAVAVGGKSLKNMTFLDGIVICMSGVAAGASILCFQRALALGPNSIVIHMDRLCILAVLVMGCIFLRERLSLRALFGYLIVVLGIFLMLMQTPLIDLLI